MNIKILIKNFGILEFLIILSTVYVLSMLTWTASTRSSVEAKANSTKENHTRVVNFLNNEINKCSQKPNSKTSWGESCNTSWKSKNIVKFLINNLELNNPYEIKSSLVQSAGDPRIQAEGKAGQSTDKGIIFVSSSDFLFEPGSEWVIGTCIKSPCVAAGNNDLVSIYR